MGSRLYSYRRMLLCDGWMISYTGTAELMEPVRIFQVFTIITLCVTMVSLLCVSVLLSRYVNRPFQQLLRLFGQVEAGNLDVKNDYPFQNEFVIVFEQFDSMISRIKELLHQSVEREKELRQAEYRQLQAHIAPHFLYNSFNVLRHCISMEDYETGSEMARLLGNYFRYITYGGEEKSIPLLKEYRHAEDYLKIQKIRFQDRIAIEMDALLEKFHDVQVPPFILQPLVENVFKHGISNMAGVGQILVKAEEQENTLLLVVRDNGKGIDKKELETLRKVIDGREFLSEHSGLMNISKRLKLLLGENAGLEVNSGKNRFFEVTVRIPLIAGLEERKVEHDSYFGG